MNPRAVIWNLPNVLTMARIAITPVVAFLPFIEGYWPKLACFVIFVTAAVTDVIDGRIARRRGLITDFGKTSTRSPTSSCSSRRSGRSGGSAPSVRPCTTSRSGEAFRSGFASC